MSTENRPIDAESSMKVVRVAVEGCCHGQLNKIYQSVPKNAELLIICGDFQAIRNQQDLKSMNVPAKYREMGDFPDYYSGKKRAPIMTIFIGGNHESSSYMRELQYGGWVAPDIYYLGEYGTIWYKGMRISGLSGIHSYPSFVSAKSNNPPVYTLPYGNSAIRSIYHIKPKNFLKLLLSGSSNIVLSHDWPKGIWDWGNKERLLKNKPFLKADMESGHFGSPLASQALEYLRPANWFSSHMHTFFDATVKHKDVEEKEEKEGEAEGLEDINDAKRRKTSGEAEATKEATKEDNNEISLDMDDMDDMSAMGNDHKIAGISPKSPTKNNNEISLDMDEELEPEKSANQENLQIPPKEVPPSVSEVSEVSEVSKASDTNKSESKNEATTSKEQETKHQHQHQQKQNKEQKKKHKKKHKKKLHSQTYFMALDKCLPRRRFLSMMTIKTDPTHPSFKGKGIYYDARALAIQKVVEKFVRTPNWDAVRAQDVLEIQKISGLLTELTEMVDYEESKISGNLRIPPNFQKVAPDVKTQVVPLKYWPNNQTSEYCEKWGVPAPDLEGP